MHFLLSEIGNGPVPNDIGQFVMDTTRSLFFLAIDKATKCRLKKLLYGNVNIFSDIHCLYLWYERKGRNERNGRNERKGRNIANYNEDDAASTVEPNK